MKYCVYIHTNHKQIVGAHVAERALRRYSKHNDTFDVKFIELKDYPFFKISEEYAAGFYAFLRSIRKGLPSGARFLKGHITGPLTFVTAVKDEKGYDTLQVISELEEQMREAASKLEFERAAHLRDQIRELKSEEA